MPQANKDLYYVHLRCISTFSIVLASTSSRNRLLRPFPVADARANNLLDNLAFITYILPTSTRFPC